MEGGRADARVEVQSAAGYEHRRHLRLIANDHALQDVPAAVVEHFEDVVRPRTPT